MSSMPSLLVPMNVAALCISQSDQSSGLKLGKIADEFQNLATKPYLGTSVVPGPFKEEAALPGIHLHWALPEALTRSDPSVGKGFPQVPNRYLVVRLAATVPRPNEVATPLEKTAWVVESDHLWSDSQKAQREGDPRNALSRAVPWADDMRELDLTQTNLFVYQGRVRPLDASWAESTHRAQRRFTALGYGTEAYAGAYPNCRNVFGFYDPFIAPDGPGATHRHLSYLVIGWYSDLSWDPVAQVKGSKTYRKIFSEAGKTPAVVESKVDIEHLAVAETFKTDYRWAYAWSGDAALPGAQPHGYRPTKQPGQTLFVGQVNALEWTPDQPCATTQTDPVAVALGTTTAEALSALLAHTAGAEHAAAIERLLNDIQFDLLRDYATAAGQASRLGALHAQDFIPVPAGHASGKSDWLFADGDIKDVNFLIARLQDDRSKTTRPMSTFVWAQIALLMPGGVQAALSRPNTPAHEKEALLNVALNAVLQRSSLYDATRCKDEQLRLETQSLITQGPTGGEFQVRVNRLLLEDLYPDAFEAQQSGSGRVWLIKRAGAAAQGGAFSATGSDELADAAAGIGLALPEDLESALAALNRSQGALDELAAAVATRRGQIFADWTKYLAAGDGGARAYIHSEVNALNDLVARRDQTRQQRDNAKAALRRQLRQPVHMKTARNGVVPAMYVYELDSVAAPRYYEPADPVILISGLKPSTRYGEGRHDGLDSQGHLNCRLSDEITEAGQLLGVPADKRALLNTLCSATAWAQSVPTAWSHHKQVVSLCVEAGLLHSRMGDLIGSADFARHQCSYRLQGNKDNFTGTAPSPTGLSDHAQPWIPMVLQWEIGFSPFQPLTGSDQTPVAYPENWGLRQFELGRHDPEIRYTGDYPGFSGPGTTTYRGSVTLAHRVTAKLTHQIDHYLQARPPAPDIELPAVLQMKRTLQHIASRPPSLVGQSMSGFTAQLRMRNQTLQMRVGAPPPPGISSDSALKAKYLEHFKFASEVKNAVEGESDASCLADRRQYNPLRAGVLRIRRLRILDAFGQVRDLIDTSRQNGVVAPEAVIRSARLNMAPADWNEAGALLPLRVAQPARLSFRYRSARLSTGDTGQSSSPIFGWVLFNRFDHALAIYDEDGRPVGSFNLLGPAWQESPGASRGGLNAQLLEFVKYLGGHVPADHHDPANAPFRELLSKLIDTIDHAVSGIEPDSFKQDQGLAVLIGRPLALVLADLRLDLYGSLPGDGALSGLPAIEQSREAFDAVKSDPGYIEKNRWSAEFAKVRVPLLLGDGDNAHDGLVGYFVQGQNAADTYRTFYSHSAAAGGSSDVVAPPLSGEGRLSLAPADMGPRTVVMLVDPRAAVHANVGLLPVKRIALPPSLYADALKRIDATFLVAPVLGGADRMDLPVPAEVGHAWSWLTRQVDAERLNHDGVSVRKWTVQDLVVSPNPRAAFSAQPLRMREGWLHLFRVAPSAPAGDRTGPTTAPTPYDKPVKPDLGGRLLLRPETARLHGDRIAMAETDDGRRFIGYWSDPADFVSWKTRLGAGTWECHVTWRTRGLSTAVGLAVLLEVELRHAKTATVVEAHRVTLPLDQQRIRTGEFGITERCDCELRVRLIDGAVNLESVELLARKSA